eukprot:scaffold15247_cov93-Skeletonema_dohrnii-CCMP3373.AAC.1
MFYSNTPYGSEESSFKNYKSTPYVMVTSWRIHLLPASNNPTQKMFYSNTPYGSEESSFITHQPSMWKFLDGHTHLSYVIKQGRFKSFDFDAGEHVSYILPAHYVMYHNFLEHHYFHRKTLATVIDRSVLKYGRVILFIIIGETYEIRCLIPSLAQRIDQQLRVHLLVTWGVVFHSTITSPTRIYKTSFLLSSGRSQHQPIDLIKSSYFGE